jgi:lipid-A-disaccharide synthase
MKKITIALIAGEQSRDILGADLMSALLDIAKQPNQETSIVFKGVAGPKMMALGCETMFDMEELAVMGIVEILKRLPRLLKKRKQLVLDLLEWQPDIVIGIDAPEFNIGLELALKQQGIPTVHYVSPSVWAWRQSRIHKIKKACDKVLALLPFEKQFYDDHNMPCDFVGHTMADQVPLEDQQAIYRQELGLAAEDKVLGVLPGSRGSEIKLLLRPFLDAARQLKQQIPELKILVPAINENRGELIGNIIDEEYSDLNVTLSIANARAVMAASDAVLLASGTATLETMLMKTPMVAGYKVGWLSYQIFSRMIKTPYFTLPNLLAQKMIVPELIQNDLTTDNIIKHIKPMLCEPQSELKQTFTDIHSSIKRDASKRAADSIWQLIAKNKDA